MRVSQVAFSSDEEYLVLSAEQGGGLAVYEVKSLTQGNTQSAFQLATNGAALRSLVPNPALETTELFAVVTTDGQLMVANLKTRHFLAGSQGQVLKEGVSCVSWSTRGKALVAGLGDGCCVQLKPEGQVMAVIPRPPALEGNQHGKKIGLINNDRILTSFKSLRLLGSRTTFSLALILFLQRKVIYHHQQSITLLLGKIRTQTLSRIKNCRIRVLLSD